MAMECKVRPSEAFQINTGALAAASETPDATLVPSGKQMAMRCLARELVINSNPPQPS